MKTINDLQAQAIARSRGLNRAAESLGMRNEPRPIGGRFRALLRRGERGQAILEMAFLLPFLLALVTGICYFGIAMNNYLQLESIVTTGAQTLAQSQGVLIANPCATALTAMQGVAPINWANVTVTYYENGVAVGGTSGNACVGTLASTTPVTVTATYPAILPIFGSSISSHATLSASSTQPAN